MVLNDKGLKSPEWKEKGYKLFSYDRDELRKMDQDHIDAIRNAGR